MEIGSFIELELQKGKEWYSEKKFPNLQIARLNSGRAGIYHSFKVLNCKKIYIPYYQCDTVRDFLQKKGVEVDYYYLDEHFNPRVSSEEVGDDAILLVNYFGIMSNGRLKKLRELYKNVIIDNSQAFFAKPLKDCLNVYSARKFVGVPDGAYVIGKNVLNGYDEYKQGFSSDTALCMLSRHEYGLEGKTYQERQKNEARLDKEDVLKMSALTRDILDGTNYKEIIRKRKHNFKKACSLFKDINKLDALEYYDRKTIPMVYPLVVEDDGLLNKLLTAKHFQGHWWTYLLEEMPKDSYEYWLSKFIIPITIDQRYGELELEKLNEIIRN